MLTDERKEERLGALTGSDAAVILGLSPFKTPFELWQEKMQLIAAKEPVNKKAVTRGHYLEDAVATWWSDTTGKPVEKDETFLTHKDYPWMRGNIDRRVVGERAILECKTARNSFGWDEEANQVPLYYLIQVAHYVAVDDADMGYIAAFIGGTDDFLRFEYKRNAVLENKLIVRLETFWEEHIVKQVPPEPINIRDVLALYGSDVKASDIQVPLNDGGEFEAKVHELSDIKKQIKALNKRADELCDIVGVYMGKNTRLIDSNAVVMATWNSTKPFDTFDAARFKRENPELHKQYCKQTIQRRMLIK